MTMNADLCQLDYHLDKSRVIVHIDIDFFAVQLFLRHQPHLKDNPCITTQQKTVDNQNPRIVSINTIGKQYGITRDHRLRDAQKLCPNVVIFEEEFKYNKTWDRKCVEASDEILDVITRYAELYGNIIVERDSSDGFFLDITAILENCNEYYDQQVLDQLTDVKVEYGSGTYGLWNYDDQKHQAITCAALFVNDLRKQILKQTRFQTSMGISYNTLLAKIGCELNKPNKITIILSRCAITRIFDKMDIKSIRGFKQELGDRVLALGVRKAIELRKYSKNGLINRLGESDGQKVWNICRGIDDNPVVEKWRNNGVKSAKRYFKGTNLIVGLPNLILEILSLYDKLEYDLQRNKRIAKQIRLEFYLSNAEKPKLNDVIVLSDTNSKYNLTELVDKIKTKALEIVDDISYYKSQFVANCFKDMENATQKSDKKTTSDPEKQQSGENPCLFAPETWDSRYAKWTHLKPESSLDEQYETFLTENLKLLYINSDKDLIDRTTETMVRSYHLNKDRVIAHLDIDCFSVQLQQWPKYKGLPCVVLGKCESDVKTEKYGIISMSYEAKIIGITKGMSKDEAINLCPNLKICKKSENLSKDKSNQLFDAIINFCKNKSVTIEKSSVDDLYIDLTELCTKFLRDNYDYDIDFFKSLDALVEGANRQYLFGCIPNTSDRRITKAVVFITDLCDEITRKTGLICSAGISYNKFLAKIACKLNKPNNITVLISKPGIARISQELPIESVEGFGRKLGQKIKAKLNVKTLKDLRNFRRRRLINQFRGSENLWEKSRGIDNRPVLHKPSFNFIDYVIKYRTGMSPKGRKLRDDLVVGCQTFTNKLIKRMNKEREIAHTIRLESYDSQGRTDYTTILLMNQIYQSDDILNNIRAKLKYCLNLCQIYGFRFSAPVMKKGSNLTDFSELTNQMHRLTIE
ncbi:uncharacterized protein LOC128957927 [Oppia nitens]|uniref:uncharacterized protein LOC128957927 n=1 Tax=Oppia nitens TaxID=1686743 RepID=UPI0023DB7E2D|nr:uncharacterized protein LOC128957927 [Oppia nitens]